MHSVDGSASTGVIADSIVKGGFLHEKPVNQKFLWQSAGILSPSGQADVDWQTLLAVSDVDAAPRQNPFPGSMFKLARTVVSAATAIDRNRASGLQAPYFMYIGTVFSGAAEPFDVVLGVAKPIYDAWESSITHLWRTVRGEAELDDGEVAPTELTVKVIERLVPSLRRYRVPDFGLNDDGSVALRWADPVRPRSFALHFGGERVSAVFSEPLEGPGFAQSFLLADAEAVLPVMARLKIADLIEG